jgi:SAM-dependent methyltransferase
MKQSSYSRPTPQPTYSQPVVKQSVAKKVEQKPVVIAAAVEQNVEDDLVLEPTPVKVVKAMLAIISPTKDQWLYDLGCGDGRIVALASKLYGCKSVGIELNGDSVAKSRETVEMLGVEDLTLIIKGDVRDFEYDNADIITLYLFPDLIKEILPKIKPGTLVVSYGHDIPGVTADKRTVMIEGLIYEFYLWRAE